MISSPSQKKHDRTQVPTQYPHSTPLLDWFDFLHTYNSFAASLEVEVLIRHRTGNPALWGEAGGLGGTHMRGGDGVP